MSNLLPNRRKRRVVPVRNETHTVPSSGWELYNLRTENIDQELIKEWNDNLTNLLIFEDDETQSKRLQAALYSAILAGFVIESMKKLEEDPQETTRDLLIYLVNQTSNAAWNQTVERFVTTPFSPENHAVVWIIRYDSGLLRKKAQDRAATRQYRWEGIQRWRLPEMIGLLPLLLYLSFSLFFAGLVLWLFHVNKFVFWTTLSIFCLGILFYLGTTTLAVIFNHAPFDTPLSDGLSRLIIRKRQEDRERDAVSNDTDLEILLSLVKWYVSPDSTEPQEEGSELFRQVKGLIALDPLRQGQSKEGEASKDVVHERERWETQALRARSNFVHLKYVN
ncbi:hypothetical protein CPB86DRAFT_823723 [Serendipita vermifera]|nr:hypothetical protein CPB86DRAFT_823723 [Serendipita vermifera]